MASHGISSGVTKSEKRPALPGTRTVLARFLLNSAPPPPYRFTQELSEGRMVCPIPAQFSQDLAEQLKGPQLRSCNKLPRCTRLLPTSPPDFLLLSRLQTEHVADTMILPVPQGERFPFISYHYYYDHYYYFNLNL